jgi:replicative DNA helicase
MSSRKKDKELVNLIAEKAVLGGLLKSPDVFWQIHNQVRADHFSVALHGQIFQVISDLLMAGKKVSMALLMSRLPPEAEDGAGMDSFLAVLLHNAAENEISAVDFADDVAETASRRSLIAIGESLVKAARAGEKTSVDAAGEAEAGILDVMQVSSPKRLMRLSDVVDTAAASSMRARDDGVLPGYTTGLMAIDEIFGRVMGGDFIVILGAQGDGKSALLAQILMHIALSGTVALFQNEMTEEQTAVRQIAARSQITVRGIREGAYDFAQRDAITEATVALRQHDLHLLTDSKLTVRKMRAHCLALKRSHGLAAVGVDQFSHMKSDARHRDKWDLQEGISSELKDLSLELGVPLFLLAQRTRMAQRREDPTPHIDDADCKSLERDADMMGAVFNKANWMRRNPPHKDAGEEKKANWETVMDRERALAHFIGLKVRSGPAFEERAMKWHGPTTSFGNL